MKNLAKSIVVVLLALALLVPAGGIGLAETTADPGWQKDTSPITLDWYINFTTGSERPGIRASSPPQSPRRPA